MATYRAKRQFSQFKPGIVYPLIIFAGESNSGGYAPNTDASAGELAAQPQVQWWNVSSNRFESLDVGTNNNLDHNGLNSTTHGWEIGLANAVTAGRFKTDKVFVVQTGQGGSYINAWSEGNSSGYLPKLRTRISLAQAALRRAGIKFETVVWYSNGINDAVNEPPNNLDAFGNTAVNAATWQTKTVDHFKILRSLTGAQTKIYMTKFESPLAARTAYNTAMDNIAAADANSFAVSSSGAGSQVDTNHWTYAGYKLMAERLIDATLQRFGATESPSISPASGSFGGAQTVTMTAPTGARTYRTTDGSTDPADPSATEYTGSFSATPSITILAKSWLKGRPWSSSSTVTYNSTATTWDALNKGTRITLSNGNADAVGDAAGWGIVRGTKGKSSGKWYWEYLIVTNAASSIAACIMDATTATGSGMDTTAAANQGGVRDDGFAFNAGTFSASHGTGLGTTATNGVIGVAVDVDNKKYWLAYNNTYIASGNPAGGTNEKGTWTGSLTIYPAVSLFGATAKVRLVPSSTTYSPPSGFSSLD